MKATIVFLTLMCSSAAVMEAVTVTYHFHTPWNMDHVYDEHYKGYSMMVSYLKNQYSSIFADELRGSNVTSVRLGTQHYSLLFINVTVVLPESGDHFVTLAGLSDFPITILRPYTVAPVDSLISIDNEKGVAVTVTYRFDLPWLDIYDERDERYSMLVSGLKNQYSSNFAKDLYGSKVTSVRLWNNYGILYINMSVMLPGSELEEVTLVPPVDYPIRILIQLTLKPFDSLRPMLNGKEINAYKLAREPHPQLFAAIYQQCEYGEPVCEKNHTTISWSCPEDEKLIVRAFWGREPDDDQTCVKKIKSKQLRNLDCPGDDEKAAAAVKEWCNKHVEKDGACIIKALPSTLRVDGKKYDPCPGTTKYLRACSYCKIGEAAVTINYHFIFDSLWLNIYDDRDEGYSMLASDLKNQFSSIFADEESGLKVTSVRLRNGGAVLSINVTVVSRYKPDTEEEAFVSNVIPRVTFLRQQTLATIDSLISTDNEKGVAVTVTYRFNISWLDIYDEHYYQYSMLVSDLKNQYSSKFADDMEGSNVTSVRLWNNNGTLFINVTVVLPGSRLKDVTLATLADPPLITIWRMRKMAPHYTEIITRNGISNMNYSYNSEVEPVPQPAPLVTNQHCDYGEPVCQTKYTTINWRCPEDAKLIVRAFWGREPRDYQTCLDKRSSVYLGNLNCPGDEEKAAAAVTKWCNKHIKQNGECKIKASPSELEIDGRMYDPCPGTVKYLRVCSYCKAEGLAVTMTSPIEISWQDSYNENDERYSNLFDILDDINIDELANIAVGSTVPFPGLLQLLAGNKEVVFVDKKKVGDEGLCSLGNRMCKNGGKCSNASGKPACICTPRFRGKFCEIAGRHFRKLLR